MYLYGPLLSACVAVEALREWNLLQNLIHADLARLLHFPFDGNGPPRRLKILRILGWIALARAEFIEVVVVRHIVVGSLLLLGTEAPLDDAMQLHRSRVGGRGGHQMREFPVRFHDAGRRCEAE